MNLATEPALREWGTLLFAAAVVHTFACGLLRRWSHHFPQGSMRSEALHLLSEIEVVFGFWALILILAAGTIVGIQPTVSYFESIQFTEPVFVFAIMVIASTRPIMAVASFVLRVIGLWIARATRLRAVYVEFVALMTMGPLLGSLITEPAAITVTALLLRRMIKNFDERFNYWLLALLFVNISIGGALTHFAAPPILMVARPWNWSTADVFEMYGVRSILAVVINSVFATILFRRKISENLHGIAALPSVEKRIPTLVTVLHLFFLVLVVVLSHHISLLIAAYLFFVGVTVMTRAYQTPLKVKEATLVAFFLGGIIIFGPFQSWWLGPLIQSLDGFVLYIAATALTGMVDNAALTYLGAQVPNLSETAKYFLVAGAISGGGLTVIANAPNAAGLSLLHDCFPSGFRAGRLLLTALPPTLVVILIFGCCA